MGIHVETEAGGYDVVMMDQGWSVDGGRSVTGIPSDVPADVIRAGLEEAARSQDERREAFLRGA